VVAAVGSTVFAVFGPFLDAFGGRIDRSGVCSAMTADLLIEGVVLCSRGSRAAPERLMVMLARWCG